MTNTTNDLETVRQDLDAALARIAVLETQFAASSISAEKVAELIAEGNARALEAARRASWSRLS